MRVPFPAAFLLPLSFAGSAVGDTRPTVQPLAGLRLSGGFTLA